MGGAFRRWRRIIDDSPTAIGDHVNLDCIGPDEVIRVIETWTPKAAIGVFSGRGGHLLIGREEV